MTDFDYQWENLLGKEVLSNEEEKFECNKDFVLIIEQNLTIKPTETLKINLFRLNRNE